MNLSSDAAERFLPTLIPDTGIELANVCRALDQLDAPIYATDADGFVVYYNKACIGFTGRVPAVGKDRWCVTWKLYTDQGEYLPHDRCPMATAIKQGKSVRGLTAIGERPDGARVRFAPLPTPIHDAAGKLTGAVNILLDITDVRQAVELRSQARQCRNLASSRPGDTAHDILTELATEYEAMAARLDGAHDRDR